MELFNISLFIFPFLLLLLLFIQISKTIITTKTAQKKLPPGPWKLPLIGSLHHLIGSQPHHALRALAKKHGPIMHLQLGEVPTVVISSPRLAKEVLKINDLANANRPEFLASKIVFYENTDLVFAPYGNYWRQMHKICILELLSAKKVRSFSSLREEEVSRFIESIRSYSQAPVNLGRMIYTLQNTIACKAVFGKSKDQDVVIDLILELVSYASGFETVDLFPSFKLLHMLSGAVSKVKKTHIKLDLILEDIIDEHRKKVGTSAEGEKDLVDVLLRLKENGDFEFPISSNNIKAITLDMFGAGTETTSTTIEWAMSEMIRNPRVMEKAQTELRKHLNGKKVIHGEDLLDASYLKLVMKETLRLHNPFALLFPRQCREEHEIDGYTIPVKTNIIVNFSAIARDPEYWHDPERFSPERFESTFIDFKGTNFEFIPFGAGRRMCPGISFAMASVELVLAQLLYHFDWKLPNGMKHEDLDMFEIFGATVRRKNSLCLVATPYSPL